MLNPQIKSGILTILEKWDEINQAIKYKSNTRVFSSLVNRQIIMFFPHFWWFHIHHLVSSNCFFSRFLLLAKVSVTAGSIR